MHAIDFMYDGIRLSEFGFIICYFEHSTGINTATAGSEITFEKSSRMNGMINDLVNTKYSSCISTTFDICKNPETHSKDEMRITDTEYRNLNRWLNRREFLQFCIYDDIEPNKNNCRYNASFNLEPIVINEILYGIRLNMETNSPFGYGAEYTGSWTINAGSSVSFTDNSDEIGFLYPSFMQIYIRQAGNLTLSNSQMDTSMIIKNCTYGETLTIDCMNQIITSSNSAHKVYNDFNFVFFKIGNTYANKTNTITSSLGINLTLKYTPIIKNVL